MTRHLLTVLWVSLLCSFIGGYAVAFAQSNDDALQSILIPAFALGLLSWLYITARVAYFKRRLVNVLRLLLAGDYEAGMKARVRFSDEITALANLFNKFVEQLRAYDTLRADRVAFSYRALELLHKSARDRILLFDADKATFRLNPAAQTFLGVDKDKITLDTLKTQDCNREFLTQFEAAVTTDKTAKTAHVQLQFPPATTCCEALARILPLKDKTETVKVALVIIDPPSGVEPAPIENENS